MLNLDTSRFLAENWQRKPLLIRGAFPAFSNPVSTQRLWQLAADSNLESRLISYSGEHWRLEHGPFDETAQNNSGEHHTLLVQAVDHHVADVAQLRSRFNFLPSWRIDDIMISTASKGGGVGPHTDNYDVFLLQGQGQRRWRWGCDTTLSDVYAADGELCQVEPFTALNDEILAPGDMLYLPPGVPHWGEADTDECITLSIGFRAPSQAELLDAWATQRMSTLTESERYTDPPLSKHRHAHTITAEDLAQVRALLMEGLDNDAALAQCLGELMTAPKYNEPIGGVTDTLLRDARLALYHRNGSGVLFANGVGLDIDAELVPAANDLCNLAHGAKIAEDNPFYAFLLSVDALGGNEG